MATASPVFTGQEIIPFTGTAEGQMIMSTLSYVVTAAIAGSGNVTVLVNLAGTNQVNAPFQLFYALDSGGPTLVGDQFTTDGNGNGASSFVLSGLAAGAHTLGVDINNVPFAGGPGNTWYLSGSGSAGRITFTC
jgi:hypothetical protein